MKDRSDILLKTEDQQRHSAEHLMGKWQKSDFRKIEGNNAMKMSLSERFSEDFPIFSRYRSLMLVQLPSRKNQIIII
uniref:Uncharacterized protein n=1 Tax=Magnetococcus massalia (strain MO-1) TaxID=451514 RepID=A0A1S7LIU1_MAGMO|nr:protein of unknown function [Candidatus Magnetococcus massalia]